MSFILGIIYKLKRSLTAFLPVASNRRGQCASCGKCCALPYRCPFLRFKEGKSRCLIYLIRPLNCRKYPRTEAECLTKDYCSFKFDKN